MDHVSVSQVRKFQTCPRQWELRYIEKIEEGMSSRMVLGSAVHRGLALASDLRMRGHDLSDLPEQTFTDIKNLSIEEAGNVMGEKEVTWDELSDVGALHQRIEYLLGCSVPRLATFVGSPMVVEGKMPPIDLPCGTPLIGYIDLIDTDGVVYDYKVGKRKHSQPDVDGDMQLSVYCYAVGSKEAAIVDVHSAKGDVTLTRTTRRVVDGERTIEGIDMVVQQMESGIAPPNTEGWHCSPSYCGMWKHCQFGGAK